MTLENLAAGKQKELLAKGAKPLSAYAEETDPRSKRRLDLPAAGKDEYLGSIVGPGEQGYDPLSLIEKGARAAIQKATEGLDQVRQRRLREVLREIGSFGTGVFSKIQKLIEARTETTVPPLAVTIDSLVGALDAAAASYDPAKALELLGRGLAATPAGTEEAYLEAAAEVLGAEGEALRRATSGAVPAEITLDPTAGTYGAAGVSVNLDFSLFFEVSERTSVRAGVSGDPGGALAYYEATRSVSAAFRADLSLSIETVGGYLEAADLVSRVAPDLFEEFNRAAAGLARMDAASLERFTRATKELFGALDEATGDTGALDAAGAEIAATAEAFVQGVRAAVERTLPGLKAEAIFDALEGGGRDGLLEYLAGAETRPAPNAPPSTKTAEAAAPSGKTDDALAHLAEALAAVENARSAQQTEESVDEAADLLTEIAQETTTDEAAA